MSLSNNCPQDFQLNFDWPQIKSNLYSEKAHLKLCKALPLQEMHHPWVIITEIIVNSTKAEK